MLQRTSDVMNGALEQVFLVQLKPALSGELVGGMQSMGGLSQMVTGMIPIQNLDTIREIIRRQISNPGGSISRDTAFIG